MKKKLGLTLAAVGFAGMIGLGVYRGHKGIPLDADDIVGDFTGDGKEDALHWQFFLNREALAFIDGEHLTKTQDGNYMRHSPGMPARGLEAIKRREYDFSPRDANRDGKMDLVGYPTALRLDVGLYNSGKKVWLGDGKGNFSEKKK